MESTLGSLLHLVRDVRYKANKSPHTSILLVSSRSEEYQDRVLSDYTNSATQDILRIRAIRYARLNSNVCELKIVSRKIR